jgi:hypothetical protein
MVSCARDSSGQLTINPGYDANERQVSIQVVQNGDYPALSLPNELHFFSKCDDEFVNLCREMSVSSK